MEQSDEVHHLYEKANSNVMQGICFPVTTLEHRNRDIYSYSYFARVTFTHYFPGSGSMSMWMIQ